MSTQLISSKKVSSIQERGGDTIFEAITIGTPTKEEIALWQTDLGYNPLGYGGPYGITIERLNETQNKVTWMCFNSCD